MQYCPKINQYGWDNPILCSIQYERSKDKPQAIENNSTQKEKVCSLLFLCENPQRRAVGVGFFRQPKIFLKKVLTNNGICVIIESAEGAVCFFCH